MQGRLEYIVVVCVCVCVCILHSEMTYFLRQLYPLAKIMYQYLLDLPSKTHFCVKFAYALIVLSNYMLLNVIWV